MPTPGEITITEFTGIGYAYAANGGNLVSSANGTTITVPTDATSAARARRTHLRLVRGLAD
jgi:hypothetical protein